MSYTDRYSVGSFSADTIDGGGTKFKVTDTWTGMVATVPGGVYSAFTRDEDVAQRWAGELNEIHRASEESQSDLAQDLYPIFVALVDWCRKSGRTEATATFAAISALRAIGVRDDVVVLIRRRYAAGSRAAAELDHEGKL